MVRSTASTSWPVEAGMSVAAILTTACGDEGRRPPPLAGRARLDLVRRPGGHIRRLNECQRPACRKQKSLDEPEVQEEGRERALPVHLDVPGCWISDGQTKVEARRPICEHRVRSQH